MNILNQSQIEKLAKITLEAGDIALFYFRHPKLTINQKADKTFVSIADLEISKFIAKNLQENFPHIPIICEEGENRRAGDLFWLIDPIDGTHDFIKGSPEFTVNIGLISNQKPVFGTIYAPAFPNQPLYYTDERNQIVKYFGKSGEKILMNFKEKKFLRPGIVTSKRTKDEDLKDYAEKFLHKKLDEIEIIRLSSSVKFCSLLEGEADLYLHFRKSMEWDTAAGHALILASGKKVVDFEGKELVYRKEDFVNPPFLSY